jgi:3-hydroxyacyl-[acyl-carrier-protein] dehydratase
MILNQSEIKEILPHRDPILLMESVSELTPGLSVTASITINPEWPVFQGHFPAYPVLPGIYITESMTQAAAFLLLSVPENRGKLPLLFQIQQMRFLRSVFPTDNMEIKAVLKTNAGNGLYDCSVSAYVMSKQIASGIITIQLK